EYIYTERNGIYIIDLQKSVGMVDDAYKAVSDIVADGGTILFVGTKKQAQDAIQTEAERCGMFYVNERWLGGMLTNFKTIQIRSEYIYTERNGIYIIDLQKSVGMVDDAYKAVSDIVADGGTILFVGTKKQAQDAIQTEAERCGMFYVNERWLGGMLTNFKTIQS